MPCSRKRRGFWAAPARSCLPTDARGRGAAGGGRPPDAGCRADHSPYQRAASGGRARSARMASAQRRPPAGPGSPGEAFLRGHCQRHKEVLSGGWETQLATQARAARLRTRRQTPGKRCEPEFPVERWPALPAWGWPRPDRRHAGGPAWRGHALARTLCGVLEVAFEP